MRYGLCKVVYRLLVVNLRDIWIMITRRGSESCAALGCSQLRTKEELILAAYTWLSNFVQALLAGREITIRLS